MVLQGQDFPLNAIRQQIASGIDIIVQLGRLRDKSRRVLEISEVDGFMDGEIVLHTLYRFEETAVLDNGRIQGFLKKAGTLCHTDKLMAAGTKKLTLPDEVDGVKLSWSQEKSNTAAKIAMLEVVVIVLLVLEKKEKKKTAQKERNIQLQLEYPEIVSKMAVLMGSGMTVEQAWNRITARYLDERKNNDKNIMPAYEEMLVTEREISDGVTGRKAYAGFAERVKLPCYQKLVRIILQSIHKGSKGVCEMLEKESEDAFDERRLLALKLGEEAGTKMLMPMMIMMAIVISIVIAPAIIDFKI